MAYACVRAGTWCDARRAGRLLEIPVNWAIAYHRPTSDDVRNLFCHAEVNRRQVELIRQEPYIAGLVQLTVTNCG